MLIGVVVMMVLVICTRMHAFPSLIISAILIAVLSGNYLWLAPAMKAATC